MEKLQKETYLPNTVIDKDIIQPLNIRYTGGYTNSNFGMLNSTVNIVISKMKQNVLAKLNIPDRFIDSTFDNYDKKDNLIPFNAIKQISDNGFRNENNEFVSMILWSKNTYGLGKTHLMYAAIKEYALSERAINVQFMGNEVDIDYIADGIYVLEEYTLLNKIRDTFKSDSEKTEGDIFNELDKYKILCIDDLVKYTPNNLDFYQRVMFQIVNERYNNKTSLILTTNKSLVELAEYVGLATADRLYEMTKGHQLEFKGRSNRAK
jgi:chromosomal replication initiation ATPase DnaA